MIALRGGRVVLPDRVVEGTLVLDGGQIAEVDARAASGPDEVDCRGGWVVPGFIDVHMHGVAGVDVMSGPSAVADVAQTLPRYGVTAFCPTSIACDPDALAAFLAAVAATPAAASAARVLGAHLESNFLALEYCGAQPATCLRRPPAPGEGRHAGGTYTGAAILAVIEAATSAVRIVTLAPELEHARGLVEALIGRGHRVSVGHSGATYEQGLEAIAWGARHATHLFNRMPPLGHRAPGLAGAVLARDEVTAEVIVDGVHVHPALIRLAVRAKGLDGVLAITDATAGAGLAAGAVARIGNRPIHVTDRAAVLDDGTLAGSVATMDAVFRRLVQDVGLEVVEAARLCATSPARALGLEGTGQVAPGAAADLVVLDAALRVRQTWIGGRLAWNSDPAAAVSHPGRQA